MVCYQTKSGNANAQRTARASHFVLLDRPEDLGAKLKASYPDIGWAPDTDGHPTLPFSVGCKLILRAGAERDNRDALLFAEFLRRSTSMLQNARMLRPASLDLETQSAIK